MNIEKLGAHPTHVLARTKASIAAGLPHMNPKLKNKK
jgi:hypothetical protein